MERRLEPRFAADQPATVTLLPSQGQPALPARIADISTTGVALRLGAALAYSATVRVDAGDSMLLGEVMYCRPESGSFLVGLRIAHTVYGLSGLGRLAAQLASDHAASADRTASPACQAVPLTPP